MKELLNYKKDGKVLGEREAVDEVFIVPVEPDFYQQELAEYLRKRYDKSREAVEWLCEGHESFRATLYLMWERDFYRDKLMKSGVRKGE